MHYVAAAFPIGYYAEPAPENRCKPNYPQHSYPSKAISPEGLNQNRYRKLGLRMVMGMIYQRGKEIVLETGSTTVSSRKRAELLRETINMTTGLNLIGTPCLSASIFLICVSRL